MSRARALAVRRVTRHVHVDRPREPKLTVLQYDRVLVLRDAIDRTVERPIKDHARSLAAHPGVVLVEKRCELRGAFLAFRRQLGTLNHAGTTTTAAARTTDAPFSGLVL